MLMPLANYWAAVDRTAYHRRRLFAVALLGRGALLEADKTTRGTLGLTTWQERQQAMLRAATRVAARHARRAPPRRRALAAVQYLPAQAAPMLLSTASPLALGGRPLALDGALASSSSVVASVAGDNKDDDGR